MKWGEYMNKWYKTNLAKMILIFLAILLPMTGVLSLGILYNASALDESASFLGKKKTGYEESQVFESLLRSATSQTVISLKAKKELEKNGQYDPDQKVDIKSLYEDETFYSKEESSGLIYTVDQLVNWGEEWNKAEDDQEENLVVCQKPDGTYYYYYMSDFKDLLNSKKLRIELDQDTLSSFLADLEDGYYDSSYAGNETVIKDENGDTLYNECWTFCASIKGKFAPEGYDSLLDAINANQDLNGQLSKVYEWLEYVGYDLAQEMEDYKNPSETWTEGNTNFRYLYLNAEDQTVCTNNSAWSDYENAKKLVANLEDKQGKASENLKYILVRNTRQNFVTNIDRDLNIESWQERVSVMNPGKEDAFLIAVDTTYPIQDVFLANKKIYDQYQPYVGICKAGLVISVLGFILCLVWLSWIAGRKNTEEERLFLNSFDHWKSELAAGVLICLWLGWTCIVATLWSLNYRDVDNLTSGVLDSYGYYFKESEIFLLILYGGGSVALFLIGYLSLVRRIKGKVLWKNSILRWLLLSLKKAGKEICRFWKGRKQIWRTLLICLGLFFLNLIGANTGVLALPMILADIYVSYRLCRKALAEDKLQTGIRRIAGGEVSYKIPLESLKGEAKETALAVNSIGEGLNVALENSMKSERLKTDLITNVSHDIKTPLTSIINYVELLKQENFEDPKIQRYLEILSEKSKRLKILTEDVVEASKVSSGNIKLEYNNINFVEMIQQTSGEFAEKFEARQLTEVMNVPENPVVIRVDGRRLWRVLSNIYNNAAKYAMPDTRVYADLQVIEGKAVFSLKNISEQSLNISADELTERFIRGDLSRNSEGSGLGLSIAESLTKMQGGDFKLYLDGDLFKVMISFPLV